jgi:3-phenylpropionate/trans-cinnamate dioxygenase ferredoxin reductase component
MHYRYLLIGGGIAADSAARGIRQLDPNGSIGLIGKESDPPYNRPPLSKGLWGRMPIKRIWRGTERLQVEMHLGETAVRLNPVDHMVSTGRGQEFTYDRLLLATGGEPVQISPASERVIYFRTLQDYNRLRALADAGQRFLVIGGGFIGPELAASLIGHQKDVTMIFPEAGIGERIFPADQSLFLTNYYTQRGVHMLPNSSVTGIEEEGSQVRVHRNHGESLWFDAVVAGLGIRPNLDLARQAGLATGSGVLVDAYLRTEHEDIFAAGDVMEYYQPELASPVRSEHEENANESGLIAGRGMAGELTPYLHLPSFYSDLFDLSYQAVGDLNSSHTAIMDWDEPYRQGVVYYLYRGRLRGVALWNRPYQHLEAARSLIANQENVSPNDLVGRI